MTVLAPRVDHCLSEDEDARCCSSVLQVGLLGCGVVGSQVARELLDAGAHDWNLRRIAVLHPEKSRPVPLPCELLTGDALAVVKDPNIDVVIELIGGVETPYELIRQAIAEGKSVVTANKALIAARGVELARAARGRGVSLLFSASVGGGLPALEVARSLKGDRVRGFAAVANGTTNFLLTQMSERAWSLEEALVLAQELGLAEADPRTDIEGTDAAAKAAILASVAFRVPVSLSDVSYSGIAGIELKDLAAAEQMGCVIKLVATADCHGGFLSVRVEPTAVAKSDPLGRTREAENCIVFDTDLAGRLVVTGQGAGGRPTASSILRDLTRLSDVSVDLPSEDDAGAGVVLPDRDPPGQFLVRCECTPDLASDLRGALFGLGIGIKRLEATHDAKGLVALTDLADRKCLSRALDSLEPKELRHFSIFRAGAS